MSDVQKVELIGHPDPVGAPGEPGVPFNHTPDTPRILDSGERREFPSGAVRDIQEGKGRCDLLPLDVVAQIMGCGENSYVIWCIGEFQKTNDTARLVEALETFAQMYFDNSIFTMFIEVAKHFEEGAKKYGEYNWQKGLDVYSYINSGVRHFLKFLRGDKDEPHDRAFVWNLMCAIWTCNHKPELNKYAPTVVRQEFTVSPEAKEKFDKAIEEHKDAVAGGLKSESYY